MIWENWLRDLPEKAFFELYRNYLGPVATPYHKQDLINRFTLWLKNEDVQLRIARGIDKAEAEILSALFFEKGENRLMGVVIKDENAQKRILRNFQERLLVLNLEDQFIINPLMEDLLKEEGILSLSRLLPQGNYTASQEPPFFPNDSFLTAFLTFINRKDRLMLNQGQPSKKFLDAFTDRFGTMIGVDPVKFLVILLESFSAGGLIESRDQGFRLCSPSLLRSFQNGSPWQRRMQILLWLTPESWHSWLVSAFSLMTTLKSIKKKVWPRMLHILCENPEKRDIQRWKEFSTKLRALGFIEKKEDLYLFNTRWFEEEMQGVPPLLQPNGDISLTPQTPFCWLLPYTTELRTVGSFIQFHLNKESFIQAAPYRIRGEEWIEVMEEITGYSLEKMQKTLLREWDRDIYSLELEPAVLLKLNEDKKAWVKNSGVLEPFSLGETTEGNWILSMERQSQWLEALESIGIQYSTPLDDSEQKIRFPEKPAEEHRKDHQPPRKIEDHKTPVMDAESIIKEFDELTMKELQARIDRKVLLFPEQIRPELIRTELRQIRGFDFNGKIRLLEAALQPPAERLEIKIPSPEGTPLLMTIFPQKLDGKGPQAILHGVTDGGVQVEIPVSKILELKRFPLSLI